VRVPANGGAGQLASRYLRALAAPGWSPGGRMTAHAFTDTGLDLVVSALRAACGQDELASDREQMTADLKRHALTNLGDRGLTPAAAARACGHPGLRTTMMNGAIGGRHVVTK